MSAGSSIKVVFIDSALAIERDAREKMKRGKTLNEVTGVYKRFNWSEQPLRMLLGRNRGLVRTDLAQR